MVAVTNSSDIQALDARVDLVSNQVSRTALPAWAISLWDETQSGWRRCCSGEPSDQDIDRWSDLIDTSHAFIQQASGNSSAGAGQVDAFHRDQGVGEIDIIRRDQGADAGQPVTVVSAPPARAPSAPQLMSAPPSPAPAPQRAPAPAPAPQRASAPAPQPTAPAIAPAVWAPPPIAPPVWATPAPKAAPVPAALPTITVTARSPIPDAPAIIPLPTPPAVAQSTPPADAPIIIPLPPAQAIAQSGPPADAPIIIPLDHATVFAGADEQTIDLIRRDQGQAPPGQADGQIIDLIRRDQGQPIEVTDKPPVTVSRNVAMTPSPKTKSGIPTWAWWTSGAAVLAIMFGSSSGNSAAKEP